MAESFPQLFEPAMKVTDQAEADAMLERFVQSLIDGDCPGSHDREHLRSIARDWIGHYAGYCSDETRTRVERLYQCEHPFFGAIAKTGPIDGLDAYRMAQETVARWMKGNPG
jgi:hypothetical protein